MNIAVFYTEGSNCIKVDLYGNKDVLVELYANKTIQSSIVVQKKFFNNEKAHIVFNFLNYKYDKYSVVAITSNDRITKSPELVSAPTSKYEENYLTDNLTSETTDKIKEVVAKPIFEQKGDYLVVNLKDSRLVTIGNALVSYSGGGNRYLNNDGLLVLQKDSCVDINDNYCPSRLGCVFKVEKECENLFTRFTSNSVGKSQVQKGVLADVFASYNSELFIDTNFVDFEEGNTYCFSALMLAQEDTVGTLYYVDENEQEHILTKELIEDEDMVSDNEESLTETISTNYEMVSFVFALNGRYKLRLKINVFKNSYNKLFVLLPQIEIGSYPTSRVLAGETRQKDILSIAPYSTTNMNDGGFVEVEVVASRKITRTEGCVILEWLDDNGDGLRIMQDEDNSIIACINSNDLVDSVTSACIEMDEGDNFIIRVSYNQDLITLSINDDEYSCERINYKGFPNTSGTIHLGYSENIPSFDGDFISVKFGK